MVNPVQPTVLGDSFSSSPTKELFLNHEMVQSSKRKVEAGVIKTYQPLSFCIIFEHAPIWLLALDPSFVVKVYLSDMFSFDHFYSHLTQLKIDQKLYSNYISSIGTSLFCFTSPPNNAIHLISGSISFLNEKSGMIRQKKAIFVTDRSTRTKKLPTDLHRLPHVKVGGATTSQVLYRYFPSPMHPILSTLRRSVGDYMDYSIPPTTVNTSEMCLNYKGLLPLSYCSRLVYYPTHFSTNGYGYRSLKTSELSKMFGLSSRHTLPTPLPSNTFPLIPVQILDALLTPMLQPCNMTMALSPSTTPIQLPDIYKDLGYTYLPLLKVNLSHAWYSDIKETDTSTKDDDAQVDVTLWDQRIKLVLPQIGATLLQRLRSLCMNRLYSKLYQEYLQYIKTKHSKVIKAWVNTKGQLLKWNDNGGGGTPFNSSKENNDFLQDVHKGREALRCYLNSSFFRVGIWDLHYYFGDVNQSLEMAYHRIKLGIGQHI